MPPRRPAREATIPPPGPRSRRRATGGAGRRRARPLGAHQSIAGGFTAAVDRAIETGCECLQIFTRNINRWDVTPLEPAAAAAFRAAVAAAGLDPVVAHDSYLINPAAADAALRRKSIAGLVCELERADALGIRWVVAHPGAAGEQPLDTAVRRAADGIADALEQTPRLQAGILVETTAGQGSCLGATFAEIGAILDRVDGRGFRDRIGVCLDTCHVFAAGYPLEPNESLDATLAEFDRLVGLDRLVVIHANDSKKDRGSRVDRHEAIGMGKIGTAAFRLIMNHPLLAAVPMVLETPKEGPDGKPSPAEDRRNLAALRRLATRPAAGSSPSPLTPATSRQTRRDTRQGSARRDTRNNR